MVGYEDSGGDSYFELFNAWGTDSAGWAPGHSGKIYGLFWEPAPFVEQNFSLQTICLVGSDGNDVNEPIEALTESVNGTGGYAQNGTINLSRYSPGGVANAEAAAARGGNRGYSLATSYTRPAQATAIGTDPGGASDAGHGNNTTAKSWKSADAFSTGF